MKSGFQELREELAVALMNDGAILTRDSDHPRVVKRLGGERGFRLKLHEKHPEALLSPLFLNLRTPENPNSGLLTSGTVELAARCMVEVIKQMEITYDAIAGIPNAGDPFAKALVGLLPGTPRIEMFKDNLPDGKRQIAGLKYSGGEVKPHGTVLPVDDLVSAADSKFEAIDVLEGAGFEAHDVLVLVDRDQGGRQELASRGYQLHSVFDIYVLIGMYVAMGKLSPGLAEEIMAYLRS